MKTIKGFTLIELMVVIAVLAIVATVALPSYRDLVLSNRIATQTNDLVTALNYARTEAIKRGGGVSVTPDNNIDDATTDTSWTNGWSVVAGSTTLRSFEGDTDNQLVLSGPAAGASYQRNGMLNGAAISFNVCKKGSDGSAESGFNGRQVNISTTGTLRLDRDYSC